MSSSPTYDTQSEEGYQIQRSESCRTDTSPQADYANETLKFAEESLSQMKDGDRLTVEYKTGNRTSRIDLHKGVTRVHTVEETESSVVSFSGWKIGLVTMMMLIPWGFGMERLSSMGLENVSKYWK